MGLENPLHLMIVLVVVLLVFGAKRLPDMGRSMGEGMRGFKEAISGETAPSTHHLATVATPAPPVVEEPHIVAQTHIVEHAVADSEHAHVA
jgi:sec-independent protein translocase protein TatA